MLWCFEVKSDDIYIANNKQMLAVKLIANLNFEHAEHVNISDFPYYLKYN